MTRAQQIEHVMKMNPTMSYAQAAYYVDFVIGTANGDM